MVEPLNPLPSSAPELSPERDPSGPDPIYGLGMVVVGVLVMGVAGAATLHFLFNAGTALTILGALAFVASLAISSMRDSLKARAARKAAARSIAGGVAVIEESKAAKAEAASEDVAATSADPERTVEDPAVEDAAEDAADRTEPTPRA